MQIRKQYGGCVVMDTNRRLRQPTPWYIWLSNKINRLLKYTNMEILLLMTGLCSFDGILNIKLYNIIRKKHLILNKKKQSNTNSFI